MSGEFSRAQTLSQNPSRFSSRIRQGRMPHTQSQPAPFRQRSVFLEERLLEMRSDQAASSVMTVPPRWPDAHGAGKLAFSPPPSLSPATVATESVADWYTLRLGIESAHSKSIDLTMARSFLDTEVHGKFWQPRSPLSDTPCAQTLCILTILVPPFPSQAALQKKTESLPAHLAPVYRGHTLTRFRYLCPLCSGCQCSWFSACTRPPWPKATNLLCRST